MTILSNKQQETELILQTVLLKKSYDRIFSVTSTLNLVITFGLFV